VAEDAGGGETSVFVVCGLESVFFSNLFRTDTGRAAAGCIDFQFRHPP